MRKKKGLFSAVALTATVLPSLSAHAFTSCLTYGDYAYAESYCQNLNDQYNDVVCTWWTGSSQITYDEREYYITISESQFSPALTYRTFQCTSYRGG